VNASPAERRDILPASARPVDRVAAVVAAADAAVDRAEVAAVETVTTVESRVTCHVTAWRRDRVAAAAVAAAVIVPATTAERRVTSRANAPTEEVVVAAAEWTVRPIHASATTVTGAAICPATVLNQGEEAAEIDAT